MNFPTSKSSYIFCSLVLFFQVFFTHFVSTSQQQIKIPSSKYLTPSRPQYQLRITPESHTYQVKLSSDLRNDSAHNWRFSLLLEKSSSCDDNDSILLDLSFGDSRNRTETWKCQDGNLAITRHMGDLVADATGSRFVDNLIEMNVTLGQTSTSRSVFSLIAAAYFETSSKSCSSEFFNCNSDININCDAVSSNTISRRSRCIPLILKCDDRPSCGRSGINIDEINEVCHPELYCKGLMMDWAFILTRSVVAITFVLIPTIVVMLLFHRRQLALHRARMHREAELARRRINQTIAIIDMSELYANDHPPTYDDLYETKEPPPCFCQALGLSDLNNNTELSLSVSSSNLHNHPHEPNEVSNISATSTGSSNPAFECTCNQGP